MRNRLVVACAGGALCVAGSGATAPPHRFLDCGYSTDYREVIDFWPDRDYHVGTSSTQPYPDDWEPNGTFVELNTWYVNDPHDSWENGWTAAHNNEC
jgi:hypothetical protein